MADGVLWVVEILHKGDWIVYATRKTEAGAYRCADSIPAQREVRVVRYVREPKGGE